MFGFLADPQLWHNLLVGAILVALGFLGFVQRIKHANKEKCKKLINALQVEIKEIRGLDDNDIGTLRRRIRNGETPFIALDISYPIFNQSPKRIVLA